LVMCRRYRTALVPAALYLCGAVGFLFAHSALGFSEVLRAWSLALFGSGMISWLVAHRRGHPLAPLSVFVPSRVAAEALYSALGSQLGLLTIYLIGSAQVTVGLRLSYSIIFAPVFSVIQGLTPLLLGTMSDLSLRDRRGQVSVLVRWVTYGTVGIVGSGAVGAGLAATVLSSGNFGHVLPYIVPVGASMLANFTLDSGLLFIRFRAPATIPHRIRLVLLGVDVVLQLGLTISANVRGLVTALLLGALIKIVVSLAFAYRVQSSNRSGVS
jgi:hypothetical protein